MEEKIEKYALANAVKFSGKANPGAVIGKILSEFPEAKKEMAEVRSKVMDTIKKVNSMSPDEQKQKLLELEPDYFDQQKELAEKRKEERQELPPLKDAEQGKVVTRIAPEPSKYNHLGHAMSFLLNYMYAKKYDGRCILRFEDTNPEKSSQEYVDAMQEDVLKYLDIKPSDTVFVSDHMEKYYEYAKKLIGDGMAYTCNCDSSDISKMRREMKECSCRNKSSDVVLSEWESMKKGEPEPGSITLRLKQSMQHKNAVMRDPVIFRLCYSPHYRQGEKYKVWPMYDFENALEEGLLGITHVLRSNEFQTRIELQDHIRGLFGLPNPHVRQYARFNITGAVTKGREIRELIESGDYIGWDDPRLVTLRALKRRGIVKEAFYELAKVVGMSKTTSNLDFSVIAAINRKLLDESAFRFFFIGDPEEITIQGAPQRKVELNLHPHLHKGGRSFSSDERLYVSKSDLSEIKEGELFRLMDCCNAVMKGKNIVFDSLEVDEFRKRGKRIIHWLPCNETEPCEILMPDCSKISGLCEKSVKMLKEGDVIQFERFGFCRLDSAGGQGYKFWYGHN
jgi:glutamyl-tRNA synthetase